MPGDDRQTHAARTSPDWSKTFFLLCSNRPKAPGSDLPRRNRRELRGSGLHSAFEALSASGHDDAHDASPRRRNPKCRKDLLGTASKPRGCTRRVTPADWRRIKKVSVMKILHGFLPTSTVKRRCSKQSGDPTRSTATLTAHCRSSPLRTLKNCSRSDVFINSSTPVCASNECERPTTEPISIHAMPFFRTSHATKLAQHHRR